MTPTSARRPQAAPSIRPARALPAWAYEHAGLQRLEFERVLLPSWQLVCHVNTIPRPGDYATLDFGRESVFAVRDRDGRIRAFHNACRHRGARLLDGAGRCAGPVTCPYHGWSYRTDGSLLAIPSAETFPGADRAALGLVEARVGIALGFVFVALHGDPPPVAAAWQPFLEELAPYRLEEMLPLGPITEESWDADWKVAMDNYLESYHVPVGHPGLNRMFTPDYADQRHAPGIARGIGHLRPQESARWAERAYQRNVARIVTDLPEDYRRSWRFYSALPNLGIDLFPEQIDFFQIVPRGPGRCTIRSGSFGRPDDRREMRPLRYLGARLNAAVNAEDRALCARVQRGLQSGSYRPGPLSWIERWMVEFHDLLEERIPEIRDAAPPAAFAGAPSPSPEATPR